MDDHGGAGTMVKRASISDVAAAAGVSRAAVSKVIRNAYGVSPSMREKVDAAIAELGYRPRLAARAMRGASFTIGFEVPDLGNDFFIQILHGAGAQLAESSYQLMVAPGLGYLSGTAVLEALVDRQVDGIISISSDVPIATLERVSQHVPMVLLGRHDESSFWDSVTGDDQTGTDLVMDHLLGLGHRKIAHVTIRPPSPHGPHTVRHAAYVARMQQAGLSAQVVHVADSSTAAAHATRELLSGADRPTAIFAAHDTLGVGCLQAIHENSGDNRIAVVGYDNTLIARHPLVSLSSIDQLGHQMGGVAVQLLLDRFTSGRRDPQNQQMTPTLQIRTSSRPPVS